MCYCRSLVIDYGQVACDHITMGRQHLVVTIGYGVVTFLLDLFYTGNDDILSRWSAEVMSPVWIYYLELSQFSCI